MNPLLFSKGELRAALDAQSHRLGEAIRSVPEEHFLKADIEAWVPALVEEFRVEAPRLDLDGLYREEAEEVRVDVSWDHMRFFSEFTTDRTVPGCRIRVHVPFVGDEAVLQMQPSSFTFNPPRGAVRDHELVFTIEYPHDSPADIDQAVNGMVSPVQHWLGFAEGDISEFNRTVESKARAAIAARRAQIESRDLHLATSSIPVRRKATAKTYIADAIVRRPAPLHRVREKGSTVILEPVLEDAVFEHILSVVRMQAAELARDPATYSTLSEEHRRNLFLATLNTHYEGRGSAEAFNGRGKTDILIRYEERNLFICECKFWTGAKDFATTIDQLFRYVGWRDTKLSIIVFVREKGLTSIIEKAQRALGQHHQFVGWHTAGSETELRATMSWPGDDLRHSDLNVFFVHTPE